MLKDVFQFIWRVGAVFYLLKQKAITICFVRSFHDIYNGLKFSTWAGFDLVSTRKDTWLDYFLHIYCSQSCLMGIRLC